MRCCPHSLDDEGVAIWDNRGLPSTLRHLLSTPHDARYRTPRKTRFRLAGCAFAGRESNPLVRNESGSAHAFMHPPFQDFAWRNKSSHLPGLCPPHLLPRFPCRYSTSSLCAPAPVRAMHCHCSSRAPDALAPAAFCCRGLFSAAFYTVSSNSLPGRMYSSNSRDKTAHARSSLKFTCALRCFPSVSIRYASLSTIIM